MLFCGGQLLLRLSPDEFWGQRLFCQPGSFAVCREVVVAQVQCLVELLVEHERPACVCVCVCTI